MVQTTTSKSTAGPVVLLVEDNPDDQELIRLANRHLGEPCSLAVVEDGVAALAYLDEVGRDDQTDHPRPSLVLLDLALPRMNGKEVLQALRSNPRWSRLPVVVFSTSTAPWDVDACYALHCNSYVVKPFDASGLRQTLDHLFRYWFGCSRLPDAVGHQDHGPNASAAIPSN